MIRKKLKQSSFFIPIERVEKNDDNTRTVIGYAYVNARVQGDSYNLLRSAMEAASDDYMKFGAIREMHDPKKAAGTCTALEWDERGCKITTKIVDPDAILKVDEGVYKGFSVGIRPNLLRGKDVISCLWPENSLVDRPADHDALITQTRLEGPVGAEAEEEFEVDCEDDEERSETAILERGAFADFVKAREAGRLLDFAFSGLQSVIWDIQWSDSITDKASEIRTACSEFAAYIIPFVNRSEVPDPNGFAIITNDELSRFETAVSEVARLESLDGDEVQRAALATRDSRIEELTSEVERLKKDPIRPNMPAKFATEALERNFANAFSGGDTAPAKQVIQTEIDQIVERSRTEPDEGKRLEASTKINRLKAQMAAL